MKTFVAVLALFLIVGAQASSLEQAAPKARWEAAIEKFWTYTTDMAQSPEWLTKKILTSELDRKLESLISDCMNELNNSASGLQAQLGPYAGRFSADVEEIAERLNRDLSSVRSILMTYNEEAGLIAKQNMDDIYLRLSVYLNKYRKRLIREQVTIRNKFQEYSDMLRNMTEHTLESFHAMAAPFTSSVSDKVQQHFQNIQQSLAQQAEEVRYKAKALLSHMSYNAEDLRRSLHQEMEEIGTWFETEAQQISKRFTDLFEYLQQKVVNSETAEAAQENA